MESPARRARYLGEAFGFDPANIHGYIFGEHGDSEFAAWSTVTAGGLRIGAWPGFDAAKAEGLFQRTRVAAAVSAIAQAVLRDQRSIFPVSVPLTGQYGLKSISLSLPCVLGREGVALIFEPELNEKERGALLRSADAIKMAVSLR